MKFPSVCPQHLAKDCSDTIIDELSHRHQHCATEARSEQTEQTERLVEPDGLLGVPPLRPVTLGASLVLPQQLGDHSSLT